MSPREASGSRIYRRLVRLLLPSRFRARYEDELVEVFADLSGDVRERSGAVGLTRIWLREIGSLFRLAWDLRRGRREPAPSAERRATSPNRGRSPSIQRASPPMIPTLVSELHYAIRRLRMQPASSLLVLLTLALGIGANTAIFSVVNGAYLDPLDYAHPDRTRSVTEQRTSDGVISGLAYGNYLDLREQASTIEALGLYVGNSVAVTGDDGPPERVRGLFVNADYFRVIGVQPVLGRAIAPGEDEPGGDPVAVLSYGYWQSRYGADPAVLERSITLNSQPHRIVGVMPDDFKPYWDDASVWVSLPTVPREMEPTARGDKNFPAMALVRDDVDPGLATQELDRIMGGLREAHPDGNAEWTLRQTPVLDVVRGRQGPLVMSLAVAVGLVLLVACANLANLQLARASLRSRETAIRSALGGSQGRLLTSTMVENLTIALAGGAAGVAVAYLGVGALVELHPVWGTFYDVRPDGSVLAFALSLSVGTGLLFGLAPAIRSAKAHPSGAMREGGRGTSGGLRSRRFRSGLVIAQVGAAVVLLCGTGVLVRSMSNLAAVDVGFDPTSVLTMEFRLTGDRYDEPDEQTGFLERLVPRLQSVPGVVAAGTAHGVPFSGDFGTQPIVEEGDLAGEDAPVAIRNEVSPGYLEAMGIPLLAGRSFRAGDRRDRPLVAVVSEALAEQTWPGQSAVGRRLMITEERAATVIGVVGSVRRSLSDAPQREIYLSVYQVPDDFIGLAVRTAGDPLSVADAVREAVWSIEPDQPVWEVMPLTERIGGTVQDERFLTVLLGVFSVAGLLLACIGIYGVLTHSISRRSQEIGVRVALGARHGTVVRMVLRQGLGLVGTGVAIGLAGALAVSGVLESLLFGVDPLDPATFASVAGIVLAVALVAAWLPARRAASTDPMQTLRRT